MRPVAGHAIWIGHAGDLRDARAALAAGVEAVVELADSEPLATLPRELVRLRFPLSDGGDIDTARFCDPKIEVELAFVLGADLDAPDTTMLDVLSATRYVVPALELIDARSFRVHPEKRQARTVRDTIADNAADAGIIMGGRPVGPDEIDLRWVAALAYRNGTIEESGVAAAVLNHPANGVAWLARRYAAIGRRLEAGQVVLAGSFTRPVDCRAGDVFHVDYGPLGAISCRFV